MNVTHMTTDALMLTNVTEGRELICALLVHGRISLIYMYYFKLFVVVVV
jgi:hypothetical protein